MAETPAEDQKTHRTQNHPPTFAQLHSPTGINAKKLCPRTQHTEQYRTECAAKNPADQSGPRSKRVDSMQNVCARTATRSGDRNRDHRNEPRVTLKLKLKPGSWPIMNMLGDTLDNVDRGCVYQR